MRFFLVLISAILVAALAGCAASGPAFSPAAPPASDQTLVYIYRAHTIVGSAVRASFAIDGTAAADVNVEGYTRFYVKSGYRTMSVSYAAFPERHRAVHFPPGTTIYLKFLTGSSPGEAGGTRFSYAIQEVPPTTASREIVPFKFQPPAKDLF
jgi:hypothetical protein